MGKQGRIFFSENIPANIISNKGLGSGIYQKKKKKLTTQLKRKYHNLKTSKGSAIDISSKMYKWPGRAREEPQHHEPSQPDALRHL